MEGLTALVVATGPSASQKACEALRRDVDFTVAVSDAIELAPWARHHYSADYWWWFHRSDWWSDFPGPLRHTVSEQAAEEYQLMLHKIRKQPGLSREPGVLHSGRNSGYQALNLAYLSGAKRILLLGFDCHGTHYFGPHPPELDRGCGHGDWIPEFRTICPSDYGIEIINLSADSAIDAFPKCAIA